jgi:hypothetical protein
LGYEGALYYGMVKEYADTRGWGVWEAFREFMQNALDEMHEVIGRRPTFYPCKYMPEIDGVVIYDAGRGIATYNLYIGKSEKKPWQRGKFGEGLKIALLTATANRIPVVVVSGDKVFLPTFATETVEGVPLDVFCICIKKLPSPITGTQVIMHRVGDLCSKYRKHVVQGIMEQTPDAILITLPGLTTSLEWRDLIDKRGTGGEALVYFRDIYVSSFRETTGKDACFSYNLFNIKLDESRRITSASSVSDDMGTFWLHLIDLFEPEKVHVDETQRRIKKVLTSFLECVIKDCLLETTFESSDSLLIPGWSIRDRPDRQRKMRLLLDEVIGKDAIIIHSREKAELAGYLGIPHVYCPTGFGYSAERWFDIDAIIEETVKRLVKEIVPRDTIDPILRRRLEILEEMARVIFQPPSDVKVEYMIAPPEVRGKPLETPVVKIILMNLVVLKQECARGAYVCMSEFMSIYGHELAHILTRRGDLTKEHLVALSYILGSALTTAMRNVEQVKSLLNALIETYR